MAKKNRFRWAYSIIVAIAAFAALILVIFLGLIFAVIASLFIGADVESLDGNVALISIDGVILGSDSSDYLFESVASSDDIAELVEEADENSAIKAIIFEINSPGGSPVASEEIANAILKTNKTTVAWIRDIGTSGAYWAASASDHIVASRASITGSIGVIGSYLEFPGFLERYNVTYRRLVAGKYKDIGSPYKEMTSEEQAIFQKMLDELGDHFISEVAKNRQMSKKDVEKIANGLFYLGSEAKELGLVDELGGKEEAIRYIEAKENIKVELVEYEKEKGFFEALSGVMNENSFFAGKGIGSALFQGKSTVTITA
ncbi:signal peptide peptidase SppA [Candidatus Woesearchaeota archaeon]|nr:signal peptide peptidase SppA [Candidatus Woesearchaeota archaeon]